MASEPGELSEGTSRKPAPAQDTETGFAELLSLIGGIVCPAPAPAAAGELLPQDGKELPLDSNDAEAALASQQLPAPGVPFGDGAAPQLAAVVEVPSQPVMSPSVQGGTAATLEPSNARASMLDWVSLSPALPDAAIEAAATAEAATPAPMPADSVAATLDGMPPVMWPSQGAATAEQLAGRDARMPSLPVAGSIPIEVAELAEPMPRMADRSRPTTDQRDAILAAVRSALSGNAPTAARLHDLAMAVKGVTSAGGHGETADSRAAGHALSTSTSTSPSADAIAVHAPPGASSPSVSTTPAVAPAIGTPLKDPFWNDALGERVLFMKNMDLKTAEIRVVPKELGPITVHLSVDDGVADLRFAAHHAVTRDAIELAMPRLRDMLGDNGLSLGNATVTDQGAHSDARGTGNENKASPMRIPVREPTGAADIGAGDSGQRIVQGLIDTFV
jgi:flagellar hook-length control protein FliK